MLKISGRIKRKQPLFNGTSKHGNSYQKLWFTIVKQHSGQKHEIPFLALNATAMEVSKMEIGRKITVTFLPRLDEFNNRWNTELKVLSVEDYVKPLTWAEKVERGYIKPKSDQPSNGSAPSPIEEELFRDDPEAGIVPDKSTTTLAPPHEDLPFTQTEQNPAPRKPQKDNTVKKLSREELIRKGKQKSKGKKNPF